MPNWSATARMACWWIRKRRAISGSPRRRAVRSGPEDTPCAGQPREGDEGSGSGPGDGPDGRVVCPLGRSGQMERKSLAMCAIAGIYSAAGRPVDLRILEAMIRVQAHRGPDGEGYVLLDPSAREKPLAVKGPGTP